MKIGRSKTGYWQGLGDKVAEIIHKATGIEPCEGCKKRQEFLNRIKIPADRPVEVYKKGASK